MGVGLKDKEGGREERLFPLLVRYFKAGIMVGSRVPCSDVHQCNDSNKISTLETQKKHWQIRVIRCSGEEKNLTGLRSEKVRCQSKRHQPRSETKHSYQL